MKQAKTCTIKNCNENTVGRGLCDEHFQAKIKAYLATTGDRNPAQDGILAAREDNRRAKAGR